MEVCYWGQFQTDLSDGLGIPHILELILNLEQDLREAIRGGVGVLNLGGAAVLGQQGGQRTLQPLCFSEMPN